MIVSQWFAKKWLILQTVWSGLQYAFLSEDNKQCGPFVYCKEFLLDSVWATINKKPISLYGFDYNPKDDPPVCIDQCKILIRNIDDDLFSNRILNMLKFLNLLEESMFFSKSELDLCTNATKSPTYLLTSSQSWLRSPPLLSLLTLMIRIGMIYNGKDDIFIHCNKVITGYYRPYQIRDNVHLKSAWPVIVELLCPGYRQGTKRFHEKIADNYPDKVSQMDIHEFGGIVSLANGRGKYVCPEWYEK